MRCPGRRSRGDLACLLLAHPIVDLSKVTPDYPRPMRRFSIIFALLREIESTKEIHEWGASGYVFFQNSANHFCPRCQDSRAETLNQAAGDKTITCHIWVQIMYEVLYSGITKLVPKLISTVLHTLYCTGTFLCGRASPASTQLRAFPNATSGTERQVGQG